MSELTDWWLIGVNTGVITLTLVSIVSILYWLEDSRFSHKQMVKTSLFHCIDYLVTWLFKHIKRDDVRYVSSVQKHLQEQNTAVKKRLFSWLC